MRKTSLIYLINMKMEKENIYNEWKLKGNGFYRKIEKEEERKGRMSVMTNLLTVSVTYMCENNNVVMSRK